MSNYGRNYQAPTWLGTPVFEGAMCADERVSGLPPSAWTGKDPTLAALAQRTCFHCGALDDCRTWLDSLPRSCRPSGVVAGRRVSWTPPRPRPDVPPEPPQPPRPTRQAMRRERARLLHAGGATLRQIAAELGVSRQTIMKDLTARLPLDDEGAPPGNHHDLAGVREDLDR
jgi:hypothetical protein